MESMMVLLGAFMCVSELIRFRSAAKRRQERGAKSSRGKRRGRRQGGEDGAEQGLAEVSDSDILE